MLKNKTIVIGITGSIAAYKMADVASALVKQGADVFVLMTKNATNIINPITFETLTSHKCIVDTFDRNFDFNIEHVALAKRADVLLIAPATANVIGKLANGIADDMLTTTAIACHCPKLIAPAMNTDMFDSPVVQDNLEKLKKYDYGVIEPAEGHLACGVDGRGKLPSPEVLLEHLYYAVEFEKDMSGKRILITAGPTREPIDPVRYITNHSTGKMGYALAKVAMRRGAEVTLIAGPIGLPDPIRIKTIHVETAAEMFDAVKNNYADMDIIIKSAAVADYTPAVVSEQKIKKSDNHGASDANTNEAAKAGLTCLELKQTTDILAWLGANRRDGQFICGFAMETEDLINRAGLKLEKKNVDMIVANNLRTEGAGFGGETNVITILTRSSQRQLPLMKKEDDAAEILNEILHSY